jgi:2-methylisocitrate lyase-like PEP mutase family enzyme
MPRSPKRDGLNRARALRSLLESSTMSVVPGIGDALAAKIVQYAGFEAVYLSSYAVCVSSGLPDAGVLTMTEILERAAMIASAIDLPVLCDVETGYGNYLNVQRMVREFQRAVKRAVNIDEMSTKIRAAVEAREQDDFVVVAKTAADGSDTAIRATAYTAAGADAIWLEPVAHLPSEWPHRLRSTLENIRDQTNRPLIVGAPSLFGHVVPDLGESGARLFVVADLLPRAAAGAIAQLLGELRDSGRIDRLIPAMASTQFVTDLVGLPQVRELERRLGSVSVDAWTPW